MHLFWHGLQHGLEDGGVAAVKGSTVALQPLACALPLPGQISLLLPHRQRRSLCLPCRELPAMGAPHPFIVAIQATLPQPLYILCAIFRKDCYA